MSFAQYKKKRGKNLDKMLAAAEKISGNKNYDNDEEDFWKPTRDKAGNGTAIIRFLPPKEGEDVPFVRIFDHFFKGPTGQWYVEKSLTTLGQDDPVSEYNSKLWNTELESNKQKARDQKRRLSFVSNIYVVKDPAHPENEGKVMKYKFGKKIYEKIMDSMKAEFEGDEVFDPFDMFEGANFRVRIKTVDKFPNYDASMFEAPGPVCDDEKEMEAIYNQIGSLQELVAPDKFKTYDQLQQRLNTVLGFDTRGEGLPHAERTPMEEEVAAPLPQKEAKPLPTAEEDNPPFDVDDDDEEDFLKAIEEMED